MSYRRYIYSLILYLVFPVVLLRLLWRSRKNPAYRQRIAERLGFFSIKVHQPLIWVHAVSVGEAIAAEPLINALIDKYSGYRVLVTSTTPTGSDRVTSLFSGRIEHVYFPYDLPDAVSRFLKKTRPHILVIMETEIWPNLYAACAKRNIPIMLANARLSQRSTHGYQKIRGLVAETLHRLSIIAVRSDADAENFRHLGARNKQIIMTGNIKFDLELNHSQIETGKARKKQWGNHRPVWLAASTHAGEDEQILAVYAHLLMKYPDLLLVLVPRHPERFDAVYELCDAFDNQPANQQGKQGKCHAKKRVTIRHSCQSESGLIHANIILGDTMGEMQSWYAAASFVFIGGSLVETGGHNPLEAIALGVPVFSGPHIFNFEDVFPVLVKAGLCRICQDARELEIQLLERLNTWRPDDNQAGKNYRQTANQIIRQNGGVTGRLMDQIERLIDGPPD